MGSIKISNEELAHTSWYNIRLRSGRLDLSHGNNFSVVRGNTTYIGTPRSHFGSSLIHRVHHLLEPPLGRIQSQCFH